MKMQTIDFKKLDETNSFNFKQDMDAIIKKVGCEYISDYVHKRYFADKITVSDIAVELGKTVNYVYKWMHSWAFKVRPQIGCLCQNPSIKSPEFIDKIIAKRGKGSVCNVAAIFGCCPAVVETLWKKKQGEHHED